MTSSNLAHRSPLASVRCYQGVWPSLDDSVFLADGARVIGDVTMGKLCSVWFNAVVRGDVNTVRVGESTNIQDGAVVHCSYQTHPTVIGNRVSIGHLAMIHGCTIGDGTLVGMHAVVQDGAQIGEGCLIGAGALITPQMIIPSGCLVLGRPGKVVRDLREYERHDLAAISGRYLMYAQGYDFSEHSR